MNATVKSDSLHTVVLRGFEFSLKETIVFRAGPNTTGKKGAPQVKVGNVAEQKVPVNATIYGGQWHKAELAVILPSHHTSAHCVYKKCKEKKKKETRAAEKT